MTTANSLMPHVAIRIWAAALCLALVCLAAGPARAQVRNLTEENRVALEEKVLDLRSNELMRVSRGRIRPEPVSLPYFTMYQSIIQDQDLMLARQLQDYRAALGGMQLARKDFADFAQSDLGARVTDIFNNKLIETYALKDDFEKAGNLWEVWTLLHMSKYQLQALPVEYRMAMNAGLWMQRLYPDRIPDAHGEQFLELCRKDLSPLSVFEEEEQVEALSKAWSDFFVAMASGEVAP